MFLIVYIHLSIHLVTCYLKINVLNVKKFHCVYARKVAKHLDRVIQMSINKI